MTREIYEAQTAARKAVLREKLLQLLPTGEIYKTLEIGCGHGHFLVRYAQTHAERFCLGIDLIAQRLAAAERKAQRAELTNCRFLKARAEELLECLPIGFLWNEILVFYPDPWPKKRHHKHRLLQEAFLSQLARCVVPNARLHFETDDGDYFEAVCDCVRQHPQWKRVDEPSYEVDTIFAERTGRNGKHAVFKCVKNGEQATENTTEQVPV
jgi:tRNA (guanine-N7-)-methyltransferase